MRLNIFVKALFIGLLLINAEDGDGENDQQDSAAAAAPPTPAPAPPAPSPGTATEQSGRQCSETSEERLENITDEPMGISLMELDEHPIPPINSQPPLPHLRENSQQEVNSTFTAEGNQNDDCSVEMRVMHLIDAVRSMIVFTEDFWMEWLAEVVESTTLSRHARREEMLNLHGLLSSQVKQLLESLKQDIMPPFGVGGCDRDLLFTFLDELDRMLRWVRATARWVCEDVAQGQTLHYDESESLAEAAPPRPNRQENNGQSSGYCFDELRIAIPEDTHSDTPTTHLPPRSGNVSEHPDADKPWQSHLQQKIEGAQTSLKETLTALNAVLQPTGEHSESLDGQPTENRIGGPYVNEVKYEIQIPTESSRQYTRAPEQQDEDSDMRVSVVLDVTEQSATMSPITFHSRIQRCDDNSEQGASATNTAASIEVVDPSAEERTTRIRQLVENVIVWMEESWWARVLEVVSSPLINDTNRKEELQSLHRLLSCHVRDLLTVLERELRSSVDANVYDPAMEVPFVNEMAQMVQCVRYTTAWISQNFFNPTLARNFDPEALENLRQGAIRPPTWLETYRYSQATTLQLSASNSEQVNMDSASRRLSGAGRPAPNIEQPVAHSSQRMPLRLAMEDTSESLTATSSGQHATFQAMEISEDDSDLSEDSTCCPYLARMLNRIFSFQWCLAALFCQIFPSTKK